ncbi:uncharacterized protein LOC114880544 isoform X3 [Osmia bicornis bicornis]|uniref:uncharacterized protein LOC114880544 isoform X3 n=1 Tax=Osmia bicornis bicornis TaxID=1437191 RepID=UPI001EAEDFA0|nr:uncharacterized protein LOC114880544 isoform X3 [Osmia bicornis bicornis]
MFEMQDNEEFKLVIHRKKRTSFARKCCDSTVTLPVVVVDNDDDDDDDDEDNGSNFNINHETLSGMILEAEVELKNSSFADNVFYSLGDSLNALRLDEIPLRNNFIYKDVFSDLNIHIFLEENINAIPQSFWNKRDEPCYRGAEIHYLTAKQTEQIDAKNCCTEDET